MTKICSKCKEEKSKIEFSKDKQKNDGLRSSCKECNKSYGEDYYINHSEKLNELRSKRYAKNSKYENERQRKEIDSLFKLRENVCCLIRNSITNSGYSKDTKTFNILGCTYEFFMIWIENQFTDGMTWDNRSLWHLDHIYPVSRALNEEHLIKLNHYTNFQPLWAADNIRKGNKLPEELL